MEMPAFKAEILAPFKMQGVADIADNALLVRFKFTARPGNPAAIQREAVKRMFNTFPGMGIEFAKEGRGRGRADHERDGSGLRPTAQAEPAAPAAPAKAAAE